MHDVAARPLTGEVIDAAALRALDAGEWDRLSRAALAENPFYSRQYVLAGLETIDRDAGLKAFVVRGAGGRLAGLFPFRRRFLPPFAWPVAQGARNLYQFGGAPLVDAAHAAGVVEAWLDAVAGGRLPRFWMLADVQLDGPLTALIDAKAAARGFQTGAVAGYQRPHLTRCLGGFDNHLSRAIGKSRVKDIRRNLRRLGEMGEVRFERASEPPLVRRRVEQFLALEQSGWKGEAGTAFLSRPDDAAFARLAFGGVEGREGLARVDSLLLDGKPIAISVNIASGATGFTPKCAYDEAYRKQSPGLVLEYLVIERFYVDAEFAEMDAATTTGGHVVLDLWNRRKEMGTLVLGPAGWRSDLLVRKLEALHRAKQRVKQAVRA